jgi:hypothetical protein
MSMVHPHRITVLKELLQQNPILLREFVVELASTDNVLATVEVF